MRLALVAWQVVLDYDNLLVDLHHRLTEDDVYNGMIIPKGSLVSSVSCVRRP